MKQLRFEPAVAGLPRVGRQLQPGLEGPRGPSTVGPQFHHRLVPTAGLAVHPGELQFGCDVLLGAVGPAALGRLVLDDRLVDVPESLEDLRVADPAVEVVGAGIETTLVELARLLQVALATQQVGADQLDLGMLGITDHHLAHVVGRIDLHAAL